MFICVSHWLSAELLENLKWIMQGNFRENTTNVYVQTSNPNELINYNKNIHNYTSSQKDWNIVTASRSDFIYHMTLTWSH